MTPRIHTSEPAHRTATTAWQRERAGRVQPATLPIRRWEARATYAVVGLATITVAFIWAVQP